MTGYLHTQIGLYPRHQRFALPLKATTFIGKFDADRPVKPFSFTIRGYKD